ncbi:major facilitator superfamily domain-containing protein, partial [Coniella lustricola]
MDRARHGGIPDTPTIDAVKPCPPSAPSLSLSCSSSSSSSSSPPVCPPSQVEAASQDGSGDSQPEDATMAVHSAYQPLWVRLACILLDFLTQTYDQIRIVPEIVLFERWICNAYLPAHGGGGGGGGHSVDVCQSPDAQYQLARLRSWKALFDGIAILLTAVPMGLLADRIGRKKVIMTSILGPLLSLCWTVTICIGGYGNGDMRLIWASSLFLLMGNLSSANATIYAMAADSCPPKQQSRYFYYLYSTFLVCELFAPALASVTIERHLLVPFGVGFACLVLCFPVLAIMPETHHGLRTASRDNWPAVRRRPSKDLEETSPLLAAPSTAHRQPQTGTNTASQPGQTRERLLAVLANRNILLALFVLFVGALRQGTVSVLLQYAAVRFAWPTSQTAMLVSAIAASNIVLFMVVLPQTITFLTARWHVVPRLIDYNVVSASLAVLTVGAVLMGLASSMTTLVL